jgi:WD40 repeat protein
MIHRTRTSPTVAKPQQESSLGTSTSMSSNSVSYNPDGKRIVSGSADSTVKVWDISSLDTSK